MAIDDEQIEKIKYHIRLLAESLDAKSNPIASLVIERNWSDNDLERAHDIFEEYSNSLENDEPVNWHVFEKEFDTAFGIGYQGVKSIVLAFYRNG